MSAPKTTSRTSPKSMRRRVVLIVAVVAIAAITTLIFVFTGGSARAKQKATLHVREGAVQVQKAAASSFVAAVDGQSLAEGDAVKTGADGIAEITYFDGSLTRLGPDTEFTLKELANLNNAARSKRIVGHASHGRTWNRVVKLSDSSSRFETETPVATAAVRGTVYATDCDFFGNCTFVSIDHTIVVTLSDGTQITLNAFDVVTVNADGTAGDVQHFTSLEDLIASFPWVQTNACDLEDLASCPTPSPSPTTTEPSTSPTPSTSPSSGTGPVTGGTPTTGPTGVPTTEPPPPGNTAPSAAFTPTSASGEAPLMVLFANGSTDPDGDPLVFLWNFGDGVTTTEVNPSHAFGVGTWTVSLTAVDTGGASDTASATIVGTDLTPPAVPVVGSGPASPTSETTATFTFGDGGVGGAALVAADAGDHFECDLDGGGFSACVSPKEYGGLGEADHVFSVRAVDAAGNASDAATYAWTIDLTAPSVVIDSHPDAETTSTSASLTFHSDDPAATFVCSLAGSPVGDPAPCDSGAISYEGLGLGLHTFQVVATDPAGNASEPATFAWTIVEANQAPTAVDDALATPEDTPGSVNVLTNDTDPNGDLLSVDSVGTPAHGSVLSDGAGLVIYTPDPDFNGTDSFTYVAGDGLGGTDEATVEVTVEPVNDPPVCPSFLAPDIPEDSVFSSFVECTDVDSASLTYGVETEPGHGTLDLAPDGTFTYTPDPNYNGPDQFTFAAFDGEASSEPAVVELNVDPVDDPPVAFDDSATTNENEPVTVDVLGNDTDPEGDTLAVGSFTDPANGSVAPESEGDGLVYTPDDGFSGTDTFDYTANDGNGGTDTATVTITVNAVNHDPVAGGDVADTHTNRQVTVDVLVNDSDPDGDPISLDAVTDPANGSAEIFDGEGGPTVLYTPDGGFTGTDTFEYTISDGNGGEATGHVTVHVTNADPVAVDDTATTDPGLSVDVDALANDSDPDGDAVVLDSVDDPTHGSAEIVSVGIGDSLLQQVVRYTPDEGFTGDDTFAYTITDGLGGHATGHIRVTVNPPPNTPPVATNDSYLTTDDASENPGIQIDAPGVLANDTDTEDDPLTAQIVDNASFGTVTLNADGSFTYMESTGFVSSDSFTYRANDGTDDSNLATVTISEPANNPPDAVDDSGINTGSPVQIDVLANDSDPDAGDTLTVVGHTDPGSGTATLGGDGRTFTYTPNEGFTGSDAFTYTIEDTGGLQDTASVTISPAGADTIVLQWSSGPTDLDIHVVTPDGEIAYYNQCLGVSECWAELDQDVTDMPLEPGVETVSVRVDPGIGSFHAGDYTIFVVNYSCYDINDNPSGFGDSNATVSVHTNSGTQTFPLPTVTGSPKQWNVGTLGLGSDGTGSVSPTQTFSGDCGGGTAAPARARDRHRTRTAAHHGRTRTDAHRPGTEQGQGRSVSDLRATLQGSTVRLDWRAPAGARAIVRYSTSRFPTRPDEGVAGCTGIGHCDIRGLSPGQDLYITVFLDGQATVTPVRAQNAIRVRVPSAATTDPAPADDPSPAPPVPAPAPRRDPPGARSGDRHAGDRPAKHH